jgi:DNA repair protein SbcC/Rad50
VRIERVTGHAFGPFSGEALDLAPGLTVVSGPNEAGKSSWHAAIRAGICGVRRGRGAGTKVEAAFEERHRPWDGDGRWAVEVRLLLDDGRTIDISQDLAGKVACRATDVVLGRDVSDEILDGTPDASRWLGLDREAFAATICVGQAQIAAIAGRETAASLQEHMQRAAATRGTDATAAEARTRLDDFRREHVGVDRQGARGPLRSAKDRVELARATLEEARGRHEAYLDASLSAEAAERAAASQARQVAAIQAAIATRASVELARRADRAVELDARYPIEPAGAADRDARADAVAGALDAWRGRPRAEPLTGTTAAELETQLASLPAPPVGDTEVHPTVLEARRSLDRAEDAVGLLGPRPAAPTPDALQDASEEHLRGLARRLRTPDPDPHPRLEEELRDAEQELAAGGGRRGLGWGLGAAFSALAALAALAAGQGLLAALALALAVGLGVRAWMAGRTPASAAARRVELARAALAPLTMARDAAVAERAAAAQDARSAGLPADADDLERRADAVAVATRAAADIATWDARRVELETRRAQASAVLLRALGARGVETDGREPPDAMAAYETACRERAGMARRAAGRAALEQALATRREAEAAAIETSGSVERAEAALRAIAGDLGLDANGAPGELADSLAEWRRARGDEAERADLARREWHELASLLDGRPLEMLRADADAAAARAATLAASVDPAELAGLASRDDLGSLLEVERDELARARETGSTQRGALAEMQRDLPDVAEAEEGLAEAAAELARVTGLQAVLAETTRLLHAAEERVHRDLAPILAAAITRWLPRVSGGAYVDASVDPADLSVRVKEASSGRWRSALLLSEGTREQIYLLLRVAMAQQLATTGETAPLLLDEVTIQADAERKRQLLGVLHELSTERQIILFTHDDDVIDWAARSLAEPDDRLIELRAALTAPQPALG